MKASAELVAKEVPATKYIPYKQQIDLITCRTIEDDLTRTIRFSGIPFETFSPADLNAATREFESTLNAIGAKDTRVALWSHVVRRKVQFDMSRVEYDNPLSKEFGRQYAERIGKRDFYTNELYLSPVYRPAAGKIEQLGKRFTKAQERNEIIEQAKTTLDAITKQLVRNLRRFQPTILGTIEATETTPPRSELQEFYAMLLNGETVPVNMAQYSVRYAIQRNELNFGGEVIEIRGPASTRFAAVLSFKAPYGRDTVDSKVFHDLLKLRCEYVLSQSITFISANKAEKFLATQISQYGSTSANKLQVAELENARTLLQAGKWSMAEHELIMTVYGDSIEELGNAISEVTSAFEKKNLQLYREARGMLITQYFGMLPGNFIAERPRGVPIGIDNFTAFFPLHNYFIGNPQGSQWGMPVTMMETTSGAPLFVNYHVSTRRLRNQGLQIEYLEDEKPDEQEEDLELSGKVAKTHRKEIANYMIVGPSGAGKTALKVMLRLLARKLHVGNGQQPLKTFAWDKDNGEEIAVLGLGGVYFKFEPGTPTGLNPFGLEDTPDNRQFIMRLAMWCASTDQNYRWSAIDEQHLATAIGDVYHLPERRRFARILDTLPVSGSSGGQQQRTTLREALARWMEHGQRKGAYAWVLDSAVDEFDFTKANDFGFDMTTFLDIAEARTPIQMLINQKIANSIKGSPFILDIAEAWKALKDPQMQAFIEDKAKTVRKQSGLIGLDTQDPSDITNSPIRGTLLQQFPTKILLPNPSADAHDYIDGLKVTKQEFTLIREGMLDEPGKFLLKQGTESVVVRNDLAGMDDMMAVISASTDNVMLVRKLINVHGNNPLVWLPEFFRRRA